MLILLIQAGDIGKPLACRISNRNLMEAFETIWKTKISYRQLLRLKSKLDKDRIIERTVFNLDIGRNKSYMPIPTYKIIDPEKGFSDLFTP